MEDALAPLTRKLVRKYPTTVLILVVMEDALAPGGSFLSRFFFVSVLILVVMEDALARGYKASNWSNTFCLNPCCNGRCTRTHGQMKIYEDRFCLNPCCNGRCTRTE